jgi:RNA-binding protein
MLTSSERKALKAKAHKLEPVVQIGAKGLTEEVIAEVDRALRAHELIKVRAGSLDRDARDDAFGAICERTGAQEVQQVGKVCILFRKRSDE